MTKKEIKSEEIFSTGNSLKTIGWLLILMFAFSIIPLIFYASAKSLEDFQTAIRLTMIGGFLSIICGFIIGFVFISAGNSLLNSFVVKDVVLDPEEIVKLNENDISTHGGFVVSYSKNSNSGLVVYQNNLGKMSWEEALKMSSDLELNEFSDWRLPTISELNLIYNKKINFLEFENGEFWSSEEYNLSMINTKKFDNEGNNSYRAQNYSDVSVLVVRRF